MNSSVYLVEGDYEVRMFGKDNSLWLPHNTMTAVAEMKAVHRWAVAID